MKSTLSFSALVQKRMFLLVLALYVLFLGMEGIPISHGYNQTINWQFNPTLWHRVYDSYSWPVFILGYGIIGLLKLSTHRFFSKTHLFLLLLTILLEELVIKSDLFFLLKIITAIIFLLNITLTLIKGKRKRLQPTIT